VDFPLHLQVSAVSAPARAAIEAAGGSVTTVYYNRLGLRALLKVRGLDGAYVSRSAGSLLLLRSSSEPCLASQLPNNHPPNSYLDPNHHAPRSPTARGIRGAGPPPTQRAPRVAAARQRQV